MKVQKRTRTFPQAGDVFVIEYVNGKCIFGRVIKDDIVQRYIDGVRFLLVYIYAPPTDKKEPIPLLDKNNLIIPPFITNRQGWLKGYYLTVGNIPVKQEDIRPYHCFRMGPIMPGGKVKHFDEYDNEIAPQEYYGWAGIASYSVIDLEISRALGIPHPEDAKE